MPVPSSSCRRFNFPSTSAARIWISFRFITQGYCHLATSQVDSLSSIQKTFSYRFHFWSMRLLWYFHTCKICLLTFSSLYFIWKNADLILLMFLISQWKKSYNSTSMLQYFVMSCGVQLYRSIPKESIALCVKILATFHYHLIRTKIYN